MDLILCRNVLMYFGPPQVRKAIDGLHHALVDGGWLVVSPSEASQALFPQFATQNFPGVILYQRNAVGLDPRRGTRLGARGSHGVGSGATAGTTTGGSASGEAESDAACAGRFAVSTRPLR